MPNPDELLTTAESARIRDTLRDELITVLEDALAFALLLQVAQEHAADLRQQIAEIEESINKNPSAGVD